MISTEYARLKPKRAFAKVGVDHISLVPDGQNDALETVPAQLPKQQFQKRAAGDRRPSPWEHLQSHSAAEGRRRRTGRSHRAALGIHYVPLTDQRFVVYLLGLIDHDMAAFVREAERNAQQLLQPLPQLLPLLGRHEKQHEPAAAGAQQLAAQGPGAQPGFVDLVDAANW